MVPLVARAGFRWMATDELILARTLGTSFSRDARGQVDQPERLYTPYVVHAGGARVSCVFRDHALSDLIGFNYAGWSPQVAADDFVARLQEAGRRYSAKTGGEATIPIILDGENAWEHFEGGGRPFLRALYSRLSEHSELRTVTIQDACQSGGPELSGIFPGSWIDANFYIWIGHADDHKAWGQLAEAHTALDEAAGADPAALAQAREELFVAEGSDWCWWYGDDHSSEHDLDFDELYRRHLRNVYRLLGRAIPDELFVSNISTVTTPSPESAPTGLISPVIDGEETSYFEWLGAGILEVRSVAGAMHQVEQHLALLSEVRFGFDRSHLYLRLDAQRPVRELLAEGHEFALKFLQPGDVRISLRAAPDGGIAPVLRRRVEPSEEWLVSPAVGIRVASGTVLELAVPLTLVRTTDEARTISFFVAVQDRHGVEVERHPAHRPIEGAIPDERFEAMNWTA
jgi:hypothetical protein